MNLKQTITIISIIITILLFINLFYIILHKEQPKEDLCDYIIKNNISSNSFYYENLYFNTIQAKLDCNLIENDFRN